MNKHKLLLLNPDGADGGAAVAPPSNERILPTGPQSDPSIPDDEFDAAIGFTPPETPADDSAPDPAPDPAPEAPKADDATDPAPADPAPAVVKGEDGKFKAAVDRRDYSKFPPELQAYVKKLPNQLFAQAEKELIPLFEKAKQADTLTAKIGELETQLNSKPNFAHDHPDGYVLDPEFQQVSTLADRAQFEATHWEAQLEKILRGEAWQQLKGYDKRTGQPVFEEVAAPIDGRPDTRAQISAQSLLARASTLSEQYAIQRDGFRQSYAQQVQAENRACEEARAKVFAKLDPSKFTPEHKKMMETVAVLYPKTQQRNPLLKDVQYALVAYKQLADQFSAYVKKHEAKATQVAREVRAGPRLPQMSNTVVSGKGGKDDIVKFEDIMNDD